MPNKHTPGPFTTSSCTPDKLVNHLQNTVDIGRIAVVAKETPGQLPSPVAMIFVPFRGEKSKEEIADEMLANLHLFTAAPELLTACEDLLQFIRNFYSESTDFEQVWRANKAIAKARGEAK